MPHQDFHPYPPHTRIEPYAYLPKWVCSAPTLLSAIMPIIHCAYQPSDLFSRLLSLLACLSMHSLREMVLSWHLIIHNVKFALSFYDNGFNMNKCNFLLFSFHFLVVTFPLMSIPSSAYYHVIQIITNYCKPITNTLQY